MGYLRFEAGPGYPASTGVAHGPALERAHEYAWNVGFTRYYSERMGVTVDGRGYYGTAYVGLQRTIRYMFRESPTRPSASMPL